MPSLIAHHSAQRSTSLHQLDISMNMPSLIAHLSPPSTFIHQLISIQMLLVATAQHSTISPQLKTYQQSHISACKPESKPELISALQYLCVLTQRSDTTSMYLKLKTISQQLLMASSMEYQLRDYLMMMFGGLLFSSCSQFIFLLESPSDQSYFRLKRRI